MLQIMLFNDADFNQDRSNKKSRIPINFMAVFATYMQRRHNDDTAGI